MIREITIETTETVLTRGSSSMTPSHCHHCGESSRLIPFAEIVTSLGIDAFTLHRWLNEGRVHFQIAENNDLSICWSTLSAHLGKHREISKELPLHTESPAPPTKRIDRANAKDTKAHGSRRSS